MVGNYLWISVIWLACCLALVGSSHCELCGAGVNFAQGDLEKMGMGLNKLAQEDPSFGYSRDEETGQTVIEGMGELHLEIIVDRLRREFKVRKWD
jgi:hypothetical protein